MPSSHETQADGLGWYGVAPSVLGARPPCGLAEHNGVRFLRQGEAFHNISDVESLAAEEPARASTNESVSPGTDVIETSDSFGHTEIPTIAYGAWLARKGCGLTPQDA
jgi:hypothetical protein